MNTNYFKAGRECFFFDDSNEDSIKQAWQAASHMSGSVSVWRVPILIGPWSYANKVGLRTSSAVRRAA